MAGFEPASLSAIDLQSIEYTIPPRRRLLYVPNVARVGFEPTVDRSLLPYERSAIDHSATSPYFSPCGEIISCLYN